MFVGNMGQSLVFTTVDDGEETMAMEMEMVVMPVRPGRCDGISVS
jgi:hypothetical protein